VFQIPACGGIDSFPLEPILIQQYQIICHQGYYLVSVAIKSLSELDITTAVHNVCNHVCPHTLSTVR